MAFHPLRGDYCDCVATRLELLRALHITQREGDVSVLVCRERGAQLTWGALAGTAVRTRPRRRPHLVRRRFAKVGSDAAVSDQLRRSERRHREVRVPASSVICSVAACVRGETGERREADVAALEVARAHPIRVEARGERPPRLEPSDRERLTEVADRAWPGRVAGDREEPYPRDPRVGDPHGDGAAGRQLGKVRVDCVGMETPEVCRRGGLNDHMHRVPAVPDVDIDSDRVARRILGEDVTRHKFDPDRITARSVPGALKPPAKPRTGRKNGERAAKHPPCSRRETWPAQDAKRRN
jgi:hypothetical protein